MCVASAFHHSHSWPYNQGALVPQTRIQNSPDQAQTPDPTSHIRILNASTRAQMIKCYVEPMRKTGLGGR